MVLTKEITIPSEEELTVQEVEISTPGLRAASFHMGKACENVNNVCIIWYQLLSTTVYHGFNLLSCMKIMYFYLFSEIWSQLTFHMRNSKIVCSFMNRNLCFAVKNVRILVNVWMKEKLLLPVPLIFFARLKRIVQLSSHNLQIVWIAQVLISALNRKL